MKSRGQDGMLMLSETLFLDELRRFTGGYFAGRDIGRTAVEFRELARSSHGGRQDIQRC